MNAERFHGSIVATLTPFKDGKVDEKAYASFVDWLIREGSDGLVPCGTTGESPTLSHEEHMRVTEICIDAAAGRVPIIAGAGSNSTHEAQKLAIHAEKVGADALLVVTPYYNKPTQAGLYAHFKAVAESTSLPIFIYNIPGRSVIDMTVDTMARLAELPNIRGVKDATADLVRPLAVRQTIGTEFVQLSGEDGTALAFLANGGHGCISVTANIAPRLCAEMQAAWRAGDAKTALEIHERLMPLHRALFTETSPSPVKYVAAKLGLCEAEIRLPLVPVTPGTERVLDAAIARTGLEPVGPSRIGN